MQNWTIAGASALALVVATATPVDAKRRNNHRERVNVEDVLATSDGQYVVILKTEKEPLRFLPIWIGETEAMQIRMQLDRRHPPRPLTLNLLQSVLSTSKIRVVEANIDSLKGGVFLGRLRLKQAGRSWEIDARPSDALGLAVGAGAHIWVSREVLKDAAIDPKKLLPSSADEEKEDEKERIPIPQAEDLETKSTELEETL